AAEVDGGFLFGVGDSRDAAVLDDDFLVLQDVASAINQSRGPEDGGLGGGHYGEKENGENSLEHAGLPQHSIRYSQRNLCTTVRTNRSQPATISLAGRLSTH